MGLERRSGPATSTHNSNICLNTGDLEPVSLVTMQSGFLLVAFALTALPANAWQQEVNTGPPGPHLEIRPVALSYQMSWNGAINSGRARFRLAACSG